MRVQRFNDCNRWGRQNDRGIMDDEVTLAWDVVFTPAKFKPKTRKPTLPDHSISGTFIYIPTIVTLVKATQKAENARPLPDARPLHAVRRVASFVVLRFCLALYFEFRTELSPGARPLASSLA